MEEATVPALDREAHPACLTNGIILCPLASFWLQVGFVPENTRGQEPFIQMGDLIQISPNDSETEDNGALANMSNEWSAL